MSERSDAKTEVEQLEQINEICDEFEDVWLGGAEPDIRSFIERYTALDASLLFHHLLEVDFDYRQRRQPDFRPQRYLDQFPEFESIVRDVVPEPDDDGTLWHLEQATLPAGGGTHPNVAGDAALEVTEPSDTSETLGEHVLLKELGRGGMGVVYKAHHRKLQRTVAVKVIRTGEFATKDEVTRFHSEAQMAAGLQHPGIVAVFEVGEDVGRHFFSMEFIQGTNLSDKIVAGPLSSQVAAGFAVQMCDAVAFAHKQGVIHRDLKPANVLITPEDEVKVTDFGLATQADRNSELTAEGQILGTPSYMPPEQAKGDSSKITPAADQYSLGAVLYAMLTGVPPFRCESAFDTIKQVLDTPPVAPRLLNPRIPADLETICLKCLAKDPSERYASVTELRDEVQRFRDGVPIQARPLGLFPRAWRWCLRNRALAGLMATAALLLIAGTVVSTYFAVLASRRAERLQIAVVEAQKATRVAERQGKIATETLELVIWGINEDLAKLPGSQPIRRRLLDIVEDRLAQIVNANQDLIDLDYAKLFYELGVIVEDIGQDGDQSLTDAAVSYWESCIDVLQQIIVKDPNNIECYRYLARSSGKIGNLLLDRKRVARSASYLHEQVEYCRKVCQLSDNNTLDQNRLAAAFLDRGDLAFETGKPTEGKQWLDQAHDVASQLEPNESEWATVHYTLVSCLEKLGDACLDAGELVDAERYYLTAVNQGDELVAHKATIDNYQGLASTWERLGEVAQAKSQHAEADVAYSNSLAATEKALELDPKNNRLLRDYAFSLWRISDEVCLPQGQFERGKGYLLAAIEIRESVLEIDPDDVDSAKHLGMSRALLKQLESRINQGN